MPPLGKHKCYRIECVFCEQLSPAEDDGNEADGIKKVGDESCRRTWTEDGYHNGSAQHSQSHSHPTGHSGYSEPDGGAVQFMTRIARDLFVDFIRRWPVQFGLSGC